jgi:SAM-dependent methyltransferase
MVNDPNRDWEQYGKEDPYFGVVSLDRFHKANLTPAALTEFFDSGRSHIEYVLGIIRAHIDAAYQPQLALDFGCGVGRCTIPMAKMCRHVTGVDVSPAMLEEARRNASAQSVQNIEWIDSGDLAEVKGKFDFVHSFIVFQHIPPSTGMALLSRLVDLLATDGIAAIQFIYHRNTSRAQRIIGRARVTVPLIHNLANLYYGKPFSYPLMQKNTYDMNAVFNLLQKKGCGSCVVRFGDAQELQAAVVFFRKRADSIPYFQYYGSSEEAKPR